MSAAHQADGYGRVVHYDPQMRRVGLSRDERFEFDGVDEFDPVIAPEISALVMPVIRVGLRIALLGIDDEWPLCLGEFPVRENVDAFVTDQPRPGSAGKMMPARPTRIRTTARVQSRRVIGNNLPQCR